MNTTKKGIIYKLCHKVREDTPIYIGMTTKGLEKRFRDHKYALSNSKQKKYTFYVYQFIRDFGGIENWEIKKLKEFEFTTNENKKQIEREFIENAKNLGVKVLNTNIPNRKVKEWIQDNPDKFYNAQVKSRLRHREKQNQYRKGYYKEHKEQIIQNSKNYYLKNKKKLEEDRKRKIKCLCGAIIVRRNFKKHRESDKHKNGCLKNIIEGKNKLKTTYNSCIVCPK